MITALDAYKKYNSELFSIRYLTDKIKSSSEFEKIITALDAYKKYNSELFSFRYLTEKIKLSSEFERIITALQGGDGNSYI